ncbi:glycosyltransferase family 4 protein [Actinoplanes rectilineatus]|uniref:glycosyltransferase family 4 protein n=1 Tax=Actinoplanes rectilineatus TaxID=113571 RepID=UPI0005F2E662|nr:glycosyltransferase family 4 protein [Actinoplanes rectilineatus]
MRVRYLLHNAYGVGGTVRTVFHQANALCGAHDVEIASVHRSADAPVFPLDPRVRLVTLSERARRSGLRNPLPHGRDFRYRGWDPAVDLRVVRYIRAQRDAIVITTRPALNILSAWFGPRRLIRIGQDHMNLGTYRRRLRREILRAYPRLDAVTVLTDADLAAYREALGGRTRLVRIPNGIPARTSTPQRHDTKVVVAAGRLVRQKGFDLLIKAFARVHERHPDWELHIFGYGRKRQRLTTMIAERGLEDVIRLRGVSRDLDAEFATAALFVLSSRHEGLPMVLLEAMSSGLPVVSFDCPTGPAEIVEHGTNGLLVPAEDVDGLAAALSQMIENGQDRERMGRAARVTGTRYEMPVIAEQWERLFREVRRRPPAPTPASGGRRPRGTR